ncbi:MAG TPA: dTMP kinase [Acidothermaceae bacterium]|nr:dTMP kinase [Acidothermaceae bacterium]
MPPPVPYVEAARTTAGEVSGIRGVLAIKAFRKLWIALSLSSFGDWLGFLAQTALAAELAVGHTYFVQNSSVGLVVFVRLLPAVLLAPLAGAFADRLDRRLTMVIADIGRFSLYVSIPIVHTLWWLFVATFLIETLSLFWIPAKEATVPNLVPREQLEQANQLSLLTTYGSAPVAALVFALLSLFTGVISHAWPFFTTNRIDLALYFDASTFLVSAATIFTLREISHQGGRRRRAEFESGAGVVPISQPSVVRAIAEGWQFIGQTRVVRGLVVGMLGAFAAAGVVVGLAKRYTLDLGGGDPAYGAMFGSVFVGLAFGMFLGPKFFRRLSRRRLFGLSIAASGATLALTAIVHNLVLVVLGALIMGAFSGVAWVTGYTLLGLEVEDEKRGRTWATLQSLMQVDLLLMVAAGPFISGAIGVHTLHIKRVVLRQDGAAFTLLGAGIIAFVVGVIAYRQMDDRDVSLRRDLIAALRGWRPLEGRGVTTGLFVAFEGGEGAGKSTQSKLLASWLTERGYEVVATREPGATPIGRRLRQLLLDPDSGEIAPRAEALLYAADRAQHVATVIRPALARGAVVVSDRYIDSSLAYQGVGRSLSTGEIERLSQFATSGLRPDVTVLLDVPVTDGLARTSVRDELPDRLEAESAAFHERVRAAFRELAEASPDRYLVIDAQLPAATIHQLIVRRIADFVPELSPDLQPTVQLKVGRR